MYKKAWIFIIIFIIGLIILLSPDKGNPAMKLNLQHGPSLFDLIGLSFIAISWTASLIMISTQWKRISGKLGKKKISLFISFYLFFLSGIIIALILSVEWMLWVCSAGALLINTIFIVLGLQFGKVSTQQTD